MKTIGLLGGMSWESTLSYYQAINEGIRNALGGLHSAQIAMYSVDFEPIEKLQHADDWDALAEILSEAARRVQAAGAGFLILCTNTMHKVAPQIQAAIQIPLLHIADATADALIDDGIKTIGLLGTAFTMEQEFYTHRLINNHDLRVLIPDDTDRKIVHQTIYEELCLGKIISRSKAEFLRIMESLVDRGAEAIILGCTEIGMLISQADTAIKLYDTTALHAQKAVQCAIS